MPSLLESLPTELLSMVYDAITVKERLRLMLCSKRMYSFAQSKGIEPTDLHDVRIDFSREILVVTDDSSEEIRITTCNQEQFDPISWHKQIPLNKISNRGNSIMRKSYNSLAYLMISDLPDVMQKIGCEWNGYVQRYWERLMRVNNTFNKLELILPTNGIPENILHASHRIKTLTLSRDNDEYTLLPEDMDALVERVTSSLIIQHILPFSLLVRLITPVVECAVSADDCIFLLEKVQQYEIRELVNWKLHIIGSFVTFCETLQSLFFPAIPGNPVDYDKYFEFWCGPFLVSVQANAHHQVRIHDEDS